MTSLSPSESLAVIDHAQPVAFDCVECPSGAVEISERDLMMGGDDALVRKLREAGLPVNYPVFVSHWNGQRSQIWLAAIGYAAKKVGAKHSSIDVEPATRTYTVRWR